MIVRVYMWGYMILKLHGLQGVNMAALMTRVSYLFPLQFLDVCLSKLVCILHLWPAFGSSGTWWWHVWECLADRQPMAPHQAFWEDPELHICTPRRRTLIGWHGGEGGVESERWSTTCRRWLHICSSTNSILWPKLALQPFQKHPVQWSGRGCLQRSIRWVDCGAFYFFDFVFTGCQSNYDYGRFRSFNGLIKFPLQYAECARSLGQLSHAGKQSDYYH